MNQILSRNKRRVLGLLAMRRRLFKEDEEDLRTYSIESGFTTELTVDYELLRNNSNAGSGSVYVIQISTGKIYNVTETSSASDIAPRWWSVGYNDLYVLTSASGNYYTLDSEVAGTARPASLYAPTSTGVNPLIWSLS